MISDPFTVTLGFVIILILGIIFLFSFFRFPFMLIVLIFIAFVVDTFLGFTPTIITIMQYNLSMMDILSPITIVLAITRIIFIKKRIQKEQVIIFFLGILLFISWLRGTFMYGLETSTNTFRTYLLFFSVLLYTISLEYSQDLIKKVTIRIGLICTILIILVITRWTLVGLGVASSINWTAPNGSMIRVISASATLLLLQCTILCYYFSDRQKYNLLFYLFSILVIVLIIVLQHRTVWIALLVVILMSILHKNRYRVVISFGVFLAVIIIIFISETSDFSYSNLSSTSLDLSSLLWRVQSWLALVSPDRFQSVLDYFIGQPFGTGYLRYLTASDYATTVAPHNFYVQTFLNTGGFGLIALLILYGSLFKSLCNQENNKMKLVLSLLLLTQLVYYITYSPGYEQGLFLGLAILFVQRKKEEHG